MSGKILVVDDQRDVGEVLKRYLEGKGYQATTLETAEEALALAAKESFDALIIDNVLPGMSGMAALEKLKPLVPVIVLMTGHYDEDVRKDALLLGAAEVLPKPFDLPVLEKFLQDNVSGRGGAGPS